MWVRTTALRKILEILVATLCFCGSGCISISPINYEVDKQIAKERVEEFHHLLDDERWNDIYDLFDEKVQTSQSKEQFVAALKGLHANAGRVVASKLVKSEIKPQASFRMVHMLWETTFEKKHLIEEFDCLVDGNKATFDFYGQPAG
jgi:hypothetical protein